MVSSLVMRKTSAWQQASENASLLGGGGHRSSRTDPEFGKWSRQVRLDSCMRDHPPPLGTSPNETEGNPPHLLSRFGLLPGY